jgi:PAS domain S-box-containing protein
MQAAGPFASPLADVFGSSPAVVFIVGTDRRVSYANRGLHGEDARALVGRELAEAAGPRHAERLLATLKGGPQTFELGEEGPAGATRWWHVDASRAASGDTLLVLSDITKERREIERLRRSESLLVDAQGIAHLGTWEWDVSQPTAVWSDELYRIYGLTPQEYTPSYEAYLQKVHPDDRARVMAVTEACFKEHTPYSHDERIFRPDGEMRWLHTWAVPLLNEEGKLVRLLGVCQDITEQKRAESAMRTQTLTRALARRLLHDLLRRAHVSEHMVREFGRGLARERKVGSPQDHADAFVDMGFGALRFLARHQDRFEFSATDLLERRPNAALPTCFLTLGYLEGAIAAITGRNALGNEMRCQSMGHDDCRFVVMLQ